ncbi:Predicted phosphoesterase [Desulfacinum hydrothermale DSM 13146]|uniref:Predicted phosphoesterase n=1 Tax=Desulfacinum hydrothermale DSM 13146 TaxID=1121390 RepID=A0A1W1XG57_9BACT|nr:metallophosphoesterase [Desulfacinum hydrothermale]SMC22491.1 Predicted phosphoesterase [Desulfacinum hydrothermale DSM 13146]
MWRVLTVSDVIDPDLDPLLDPGRFGPVDMIFSCGDLPPEYLIRLSRSFDLPVHYVRGNHDIRPGAMDRPGLVNLHRRVTIVEGLRVLGLEGSMWYNGGPVQYREKEMQRLLRGLRASLWWHGGVDVVITHAPPRGVGDGEDLCHRGFESFLELIRRYQPAYFIHGHIHRSFADPSERITRLGRTLVINTFGFYLLEIDHERVAPHMGLLEKKGPARLWHRLLRRPAARRRSL